MTNSQLSQKSFKTCLRKLSIMAPEKETQKGKMKNTKVQKSQRCENVKSKDVKMLNPKNCENVKSKKCKNVESNNRTIQKM